MRGTERDRGEGEAQRETGEKERQRERVGEKQAEGGKGQSVHETYWHLGKANFSSATSIFHQNQRRYGKVGHFTPMTDSHRRQVRKSVRR